jgi:hypothetical protein
MHGIAIERLCVFGLPPLDPNLIGYVQLCDVPLVSKHSTYMEEALYERMVPGAT